MQIAIIGAGLAGLSAARRLKAAGVSSVIFEKSHGLGGRMSTRRVGNLQFDHGAQFFTAKGDRFRALLEEWLAKGSAAAWGEASFVGTPAMTSPAHALGQGQQVITKCQVSALQRGSLGWRVQSPDGALGVHGNGHFAGVILAIPAPQAQVILAASGMVLPGMEIVRYAPCIALMLAYAAPVQLVSNRNKLDDPVISWIARNSSKPGRPPNHETLVVHASPDWSREHLDDLPEISAVQMLARFRELTGVTEEPIHQSAHRWRYALVEKAAEKKYFIDREAGIGACGDWCLGPRVEAAFESGEALANAFLESYRL